MTLIELDDLIRAMRQEDKRNPGIPWSISGVQRIASQIPIIEAYTAEQVSEIIREAQENRIENGSLRTGLEFLKNCINCKIRNTCPRHCGKVVHGCDHWEYGDPAKDAAPVVHGRWVHVPSSDMMSGKAYKCSECGKMRYGSYMPNYCQCCGAKMDSGENS